MAESVDAPDLDDNLSARRETGDVELLKFGEPCKMAIPSQARRREGVETRRAAPKLRFAGNGEGIVQTTNAHRAAAKVVVGKKIRWALACGGSSPPARTTTSEFTEQGTAQSQSWHQRRSREMALEPRAMVAIRKPNGFLPSQTTVQHRRYERRR